jgi:hypothetical protein
MTALAIPEDPYAIMTRGQLEARILDGDRAQATAPPEISTQLRLTAQAEADAWHQSADAATAHDQPTATNAEALASQLAGDKTRLEAMNTAYEAWSARTSTARETAAQAGAELERRGRTRPPAALKLGAIWSRPTGATKTPAGSGLGNLSGILRRWRLRVFPDGAASASHDVRFQRVSSRRRPRSRWAGPACRPR